MADPRLDLHSPNLSLDRRRINPALGSFAF
jgi:hypothetical protein